MPFDAFLSYARADDKGFRDGLVAGLSGAGVKLWFDRELLPSRGTTFDQEIRRAIEDSTRLIVILGTEGLASDYVAQEWGFADDRGVPVIPVLYGSRFEDLPERLAAYHAVDARPPRSAEDVAQELARLVSEPVQPLGICHGVSAVAPHELSRPDLIERLWLALGLDRQRPEDAGRAPRSAVLYGVSGAGKSTVAAAFARSVRSRRVFPDGIVWLTCGPSFAPLAGARQVLQAAAVGARLPASDDEVADTLAGGLGRRELLLVLDDVRDADGVTAFLGALGPGGRSVLTTLDKAVATTLGANAIAVEPLDDDAARRLLEGWAGERLPREAEEVIAGAEGFPFALAIAGAMVGNSVSWMRVAQAFGSGRLDLLQARFPGYPHVTLLRALAASFDALAADDPRAAACYLELAAFRPGAFLTEPAIVRLWSRAGRLDTLEAALVLPKLERRLLIMRRGERFVLHGLQEDFVRLECDSSAALEAALIASYRAEKGEGPWSGVKDDGYIFDHLVDHLVALGQRPELLAAVDREWVNRQLVRRGDLGQALDDVRAALDAAAAPPLDLAGVARLGVLAARISGAVRGAPAALVGAIAAAGDADQALRWAGDNTNPQERFEALVRVAEALLQGAEPSRARQVIRAAAVTISSIGGVAEIGGFSGLTALNAVHALVDFPWPDQWEGASDEDVAVASIPLDAVVRLAPLALEVGSLAELATTTHPYWELYGHLIPPTAVELLAIGGEKTVAAALLDAIPRDTGLEDDPLDAGRYRYAVACAAVERFDDARAIIETLPGDYSGVGYRGLARHLARAGRAQEAVDLIGRIADDTVANHAAQDVIEATIERSDPDESRVVAAFAMERDWVVASAWVLAAGGDPSLGLDLLDRSPRDDLSLGLGVRFGEILRHGGRAQEAADVANRLVPVAERRLGLQWFAPETIGASQEDASSARALLALTARTGQPIPAEVTPVALLVESQWGTVPEFKLLLIAELAIAGRFAESIELAGWGLPYTRALGLATALAVASETAPPGERRAAAEDLGEALGHVEARPDLDIALGAVMRILLDGGLDDAAEALVARLLPRPGLWSAVGQWALARARAGDVTAPRSIVRQLLVERPLEELGSRARAAVLSAVAARRGGPSADLDAACALLVDLEVAAGSLDVVFELVDLVSKYHGDDAAHALATSVGQGRPAELAEGLLRDGSLTWDGSDDDIAAAAVVRAVASAAVVLTASRRQARKWLGRAEMLAAQAQELAPTRGTGVAVARYLGAARAAVKSGATGPAEGSVPIAWLLWERGHRTLAVRYARRVLADLRDPLTGGPQVLAVDEFERRFGLFSAARAGLRALLAVEGDQASAATATEDEKGYGWLSLTLGERMEIQACVALGLHSAGDRNAAHEALAEAIEPATTLARRGEMAGFGRLCHAALTLLPAGESHRLWTDWLIAAADAGSHQAAGLIAEFVRWAPEADSAIPALAVQLAVKT